MVSKYIQLSLLWTVVNILKLIGQRYKSLTKSEKWLSKNPSIPFDSFNPSPLIRFSRKPAGKQLTKNGD